MPPSPPRSLPERAAPIVLLTGAWLAVLALVPPRYEVPQGDDWAYFEAVRQWFETGSLPHLGWNDPTFLGQAAWGALFCRFLGVSYTTLRLSTLVLAWIGALSLFGILRRCGVGRWKSAAGAALLLFNPIHLVVSYSFNTDVPYVALATLATWLLLRALDRQSIADLLLAGIAAAASCLVRQQGVLLAAFAAAWVVAVEWRARPRRWFAALALVAPVAIAMVGHAAWLRAVTGGAWVPTWSSSLGSQSVPRKLLLAASDAAAMALNCGIFVLPLLGAAAVGARPSQHFNLAAIGFGAASLALMALQPEAVRGWPYAGGGVLTRLGYNSEALSTTPLGPKWLWQAATVAAPLAAAGLALASARTGREAWRGSGTSRRVALVVLLGLAQLVPSLAFTAVYDRYVLVALPAVIVVAAAAFPWTRIGAPAARAAFVVGGALLVLFAGLSVEWLRACVDRAKARWEVASEAVESGLAPAQVPGGFEWEGAHLYLESLRTLGLHPPFDLEKQLPWVPLRDPRCLLAEVDDAPPHPLASRDYRPFLASRDRHIVAIRLHRRDEPPRPSK